MSLERLGVEYIDLYQFHNVSDPGALKTVLDPDGPMAVLRAAQKSGRIRHIGVTSHQIDTAREAIKSGQFATIMFPFNVVTTEAAEDLIPLCRKYDVGFIAMKPLAGGMLENIAIAFKYLMQFPDVLIIPGIEKIHEIDEIVAVMENRGDVTESEHLEIQRLQKELGTRFCRRCDYCQPCSAGISISIALHSRSFFKRLPSKSIFSGWVASAMEKAAECTQCGDCEERCPFNLPIREMIAECVQSYGEEKKAYQNGL